MMASVAKKISQTPIIFKPQISVIILKKLQHGNILFGSLLHSGIRQTTDSYVQKYHHSAVLPTKCFCSKSERQFLNFTLSGLLYQYDSIRHYATKRKSYNFPELKAEDLEESFVRGSGPGGQAVNQTSNCVVLKHIPSGIVIKCQETRSLDKNRKIARMRLEEKLDFDLHGDESYLGQQQLEHRKEKLNKRKKSKDKLAMKKAFKESLKEDLE